MRGKYRQEDSESKGLNCCHTLSKDVDGMVRNFSQSCQNKMFSSLTSDFKKACGQYHTWYQHIWQGSSEETPRLQLFLEMLRQHITVCFECLTVKCWTPQGSSSSFSNETAQLITLLAGPAPPHGVPGRLELLPPQPRADIFNSTTHIDTNTPVYQRKTPQPRTRLNEIFPHNEYGHASVCTSAVMLTSVRHCLTLSKKKEGEREIRLWTTLENIW